MREVPVNNGLVHQEQGNKEVKIHKFITSRLKGGPIYLFYIKTKETIFNEVAESQIELKISNNCS